MINKDFFAALDELEKEKHIDKKEFIASLEAGLSSAYKKEYGDSMAIEVKLTPEQNKIRVFAYRTIVEEVTDEEKQISLQEAKKIKPSYKIGDTISQEIAPKNFSRIAAQTARQVIVQKLMDLKKEQIISDMSQKTGEIVTAIVRRVESVGEKPTRNGKPRRDNSNLSNVYVEILPTQMEGYLPVSEQIRNEKYNVGDTIKVLVLRLVTDSRTPQVIVSRAHPDFVRWLFEMDVPEIKSKLVTIKGIVREAGFRTKVAVYSEDPNLDAVGACIGPKGSRINVIVQELNGERIDVISWCPDALEFIARAISPAKAVQVSVNDITKTARVIVNDEMLSLAIGKEGQNARLAAKLTGWTIDIKSLSSLANAMESSDSEKLPTSED